MKEKNDFFSNSLISKSFFLLIKPNINLYLNKIENEHFHSELEKLVNLGLKNIEISWSSDVHWCEFVKKIKLKYPEINLGSASILNEKSVEESLNLGLDFSMMKFWDKKLFNYAKKKNYLLVPGIKNLSDLKEAINLDCKIVKIYPVKSKDNAINILNYKNIDFIAAGGLSINDVKDYESLGYKTIVIGDKAIKNKKFDPKIYQYLKNN
tara:strand:+ start:954 stop:1580 length:627 start_codon:yes stop_codon:yes gene_type:complete